MPYLTKIRHDLELKCTCWLYLALSFLHEFCDVILLLSYILLILLMLFLSSYADFQISDGVAGNAQAEANAVFVGATILCPTCSMP
jgi:hypothetical protein